MELDERLQQIRDRIRTACEAAGRDPAEVMLLPVSKITPPTPSES